MQLILASQSPRRKEILEYFSLPFIQRSPYFDEESYPFDNDPIAYAIALAKGKAASLVDQFPHHLILSADTVVYCEGKVYGKPSSHEHAYQMLQELSGRWHSVYTALTLCQNNKRISECEETKVLFHPLQPQEIRRYVETFHTFDKAGSYAIQKGGSIIVRKIDGCFYNVMGLPLALLKNLLQHFGIDLWDYLPPQEI